MQVQQRDKSRFTTMLMLFTIGVVIGVCSAYQLISSEPQFPLDRDEFVLTEFKQLPSHLG